MELPLKKKRAYGPDVCLRHHGQTLVVEKTYRNRGLPVRLLGALLVCWERFIYSRLQGVRGVPQLMAGPDCTTLITSFMGGNNLRETGRQPGEEYFRDLARLIEDMHACGVIHLDLRNRRNYGIDEQGDPYLVDFASSMYIPFPAAPVSRTLVRILAAIDWMGYAKIKQRLAPELITDREKDMLTTGTLLSAWWLPTKALRMIRDIATRLRS